MGQYTPFVIRTGLLYSYKITFIPVCITAIITTVYALFENPSALYTFPVNIQIVAWFPLWAFATWISRSAVDGAHGLFGVIDSELTEDKKVHPSIARSCEDGGNLRALFSEDAEFDNFRKRVHSTMFSKWELPIAVVGFLFYMIVLLAPVLDGSVTMNLPDSMLFVSNAVFFFIMSLGMGSIAVIVGSMVAGIRLIDSSRDNLRITEYIRNIRSDDHSSDLSESSKEVDYHTFALLTRPIGQVLFNVTIGVIGLVVFLDSLWTLILLSSGHPVHIMVTVFSITSTLLVVVFFFWTQNDIHKLLEESRDSILEALIRKRSLMSLDAFCGVRADADKIEDFELHEKRMSINRISLEVLDRMIGNIESASTRSYSPPKILQLASAAAITVTIALLQVVFEILILPTL